MKVRYRVLSYVQYKARFWTSARDSGSWLGETPLIVCRLYGIEKTFLSYE